MKIWILETKIKSRSKSFAFFDEQDALKALENFAVAYDLPAASLNEYGGFPSDVAWGSVYEVPFAEGQFELLIKKKINHVSNV